MNSKIPASCRAVLVDSASRKLVLGSVPVPSPGAGEILIKVLAIGVNRLDLDQKKGNYRLPAGASPVLGLEAAGTVAAVGKGVSRYKTGDRVMALMNGGAYAEYAVSPEETALPIPPRSSFEEAAAVPEAYLTVWSNVFMDAKLKPKEVLLVHGGASGVGSAAIQIAKSFGSVVVAAAGSDEKVKFCLELGADCAINDREKDFEAEALKFLGSRGVDVVFDWIGPRYLQKHLSLLGRRGRLVFIDSRTEGNLSIDPGLLMRKNLIITGSLLRPRPLEEKRGISDEVKRHLLPKLASGELKPRVSESFPLARAEDAHRAMDSGKILGKIVLTV